ncbi:4-hydroxy-tetrahydrodipicolinate synthase [Paenibacillus sp.]|uniref:4-hydroxy-tetrahydrodipicolinate synthase n=1 Tax=Paenibacillus sp. TaxID=58172 RepID=UPI002D51D129|nr:4-hydroxy-tetrahydrodipicolinate synthase [Paenibacillus sp.]HZG55019.1 4-hydroxy-tetrahydrodipicolinate synthase [Paenibacillus sp.]
MFKPEGIVPAMVTPLRDDQSLNEPVLRQLVRRYIAAGVHGLFCLGTNGEFFSLSFEEKVKVIEIVVEEAGGRVPVYAGTGCVSTQETIRLTGEARRVGADVASIITPYFLAYTQQELKEHFLRVADAAALPIILYNIPGRTGNALHPATVAELTLVPNIVGVKDSSGQFDNLLQYIGLSGSGFSVLAGTDSLILPSLFAGGSGAIAATANVFPEDAVSVYESWKRGAFEEANEAQNRLNAFRSVLSIGTLPSVLKEAMMLAGYDVGPPRSPVAPLDDAQRELLKRVYGSLTSPIGTHS